MIIDLNQTESNPSSVTANPAPEFQPAATGLVVTAPKRKPRHGKLRAGSNFGVQGALIVTALAVATSAHGAVATWNSSSEGGGDANAWNEPNNWVSSYLPQSSDTAVFNSPNYSYTVELGGSNVTVATVSINSSESYQFSDGSLSLGSGVLVFQGSHSMECDVHLLGSTNDWSIASGADLTVSGGISGGTTLQKSGDGTLTLASANSYTNDTVIAAGTLAISEDSNLGNPANPLYILSPGTLEVTNSFTLNRAVIFSGGTVEVTAGATLTLATNVTGSGVIVKNGDGNLELTGGSSVGSSNSFNVSAGTLLVNSDLSTAPIVVSSGAVLTGGGTTAGNVSIQPGGVISPGSSAGSFSIGGSLTNNGTYLCELDGESSDNLIVSSNLNLSGSTLDIEILGGGVTNVNYIIATYGTRSGTFATVSNLPPYFSVDYAYSSGGNSNNIALVYSPVASDACTNAPVVSEGTYSGSNALATHDGTSSCGSSLNSRDVWFVYKASSNGVANARTGPDLGTDFDTTLAVFDGCGGNQLISNDDAYNDPAGISEVSWQVSAGQMYWIRVAGLGGDTGNYTLEVRVDPQPSNDHCANALAVADGSYFGTTFGTTTEGSLACANPETHDVWFVYTNSTECARDVTFSTCGGSTDFDTVLRVYDGCGGILLGGNDDGCPGPNPQASKVTRTVASGASVRIRLYGFGNVTGNFEFNVTSVYNPLSLCAATVLHWALEEGGGTNTTEAVSGATNVAFLSGPASWTSGIAPGSANALSLGIDIPSSYVDAGTLTTNGNYVAGGDPGYLVLSNNWSITAWVRLPSPQGAVGDRVIASSDTGGAFTWWLFFIRNANVQDSLGFDFSSVRVDSDLRVPLNQPVFVAILGDSSGAAVGGTTNKHRFAMWDGSHWQTSNGSEFIHLRLQGLELGSFNTGTRQFDGVIDDVCIFNRTLNQTELAILAAQRPSLVIAPAGAGSNTVSWTPDLPGYLLQETPSLAPAGWSNSPSGAINPITVSATNSATFYRLFKP